MCPQTIVSTTRTTENPVGFSVILLLMAEKELAAFTLAVSELLGPEQARQTIEDWIEQLQLMDWATEGVMPHWRGLTMAAASRLLA